MNQICGVGATSIIRAERGLVFSCVTQKTDGDETVAFKYYDFITNSVAIVTRDVYAMAKFGKNHELIIPHIKNVIDSRAVNLPLKRIMVCERDGSAMVFGADGSIRWKGAIKYKGFGPSDIAADEHYIWCTFPESNAVIKYNTISMRHDFIIGGSASGGLHEPHSIFLNDDGLNIASLDGSICCISQDDFQMSELHRLAEPIYQYTQSYSNEVVLCKSGIYTID